MKRVLVLLLLLALASVSYATDDVSDSELIRVSLMSQNPDPVQPGSFFDARFKIENNGSGTAENLEFKIIPEYPFSFYGDSSITNIGTLGGYQERDKAPVVKYTLQVSPSASDGVHKLKAAFKTKRTSVWVSKEFNINVQSRYAIVAIDRVSSEPSVISPGQSAAVKVSVKNFVNSVMKDLKVSLTLSPNFVPVNSSNERVVNELGPAESVDLVFYVMAVPDADGGSYSIPAKITYSDNLGKNFSRDSEIGLVIGSSPDLAVNIESTDIYTAGKHGKIVLKFTNKGLTDIKFLNVRVSDTPDFSVLSPAEVYIGKVDSDDYETAEFTIFVNNGKRAVQLLLNLDYSDINNNHYSEARSVELKLYSSSQARKFGLVKSSGITGVFIMLVIIAGGYFAYKRWKKHKK